MTLGRRGGALATLLACLLASSAAADDSSETRLVSVEARAKAADAYDQGTSAYLSDDYEQAAHWFERAYRLVPTSAALLQAVRCHDKAGNDLRAANLSLELRQAYPDDERAGRTASAILSEVAPSNVLVEATCAESCTLELDGVLMTQTSFFVTPDVDHELKAAFPVGETATTLRGEPGAVKEVTLVAPAPPPPPPVPRWAFLSSLGATLALGAAAVWSGVDANRGVSAYESAARTASSPGINTRTSPTPAQQAQALLEEGQRKERRTNILIGVTAGMAATTAVLGVFTNWRNEEREHARRPLEPAVGVARNGGTVALRGSF